MMKIEKNIKRSACGNQDGFALVLGLLMMLVLSILSVSAMNNANMERTIADNDLQEKRDFYAAETACLRGGQWLRNLQLAKAENYADAGLEAAYVGAGDFDSSMLVRDVDGVVSKEAQLGESLNDYDHPYDYEFNIRETADPVTNAKWVCRTIPGNDPNVRKCFYDVDECKRVGSDRTIAIRLGKPTDFN